MDEFTKAIEGERIVIDFYADWCGPCREFAPTFHAHAETLVNKVNFYKVNVDEAIDIVENCNIRAMPTFLFYSNGVKVAELCGANKANFQRILSEGLHWTK